MCPLYKNAPLRERGVDRFARADTQNIKQQKKVKWWRCGGVMIFVEFVYIYVCKSGCTQVFRKGGLLNTHKRNTWKWHTAANKLVAIMRQQNSATWQKKTKPLEKARSKNNSRKKKNAKPPTRQECTKTKNYAKVTSTTMNDDTSEYDSYVYMMIIVIGLLWARKKMQHEKQTDVRLAKCLRSNQRLHFSNLGLNYRDTSTARDRA